MGKPLPPPVKPKKLPPPLPPPLAAPEPPARSGLVGEVFEVVERIESNPEAQQAVHDLRFAAGTIRRSGATLATQLRQALRLKWQEDEKLRPWVLNAVHYARELLDR